MDLPDGWKRLTEALERPSHRKDGVIVFDVKPLLETMNLLKEMAELLEAVCPDSEVIKRFRNWK